MEKMSDIISSKKGSLHSLSKLSMIESIDTNAKIFENYEIKNVRNLKKYDCWEEDMTPEMWVLACHNMEEGEVHARVPIYLDKQFVIKNFS